MQPPSSASAASADALAMPPPPAKRQLRPTASLPTTAEIYSEKHGIASDLLAQLQNIGRKGRQNVAMGNATHRSFDRTRSVPSHVFSAESNSSASASGGGGFTTALDDYAHAQQIIYKEQYRTREVQPFYSSGGPGAFEVSAGGSAVDSLSLSPRGRKLKFGADGEVEEEMEWDFGHGTRKKVVSRAKEIQDQDLKNFNAARKRRSSPALPEDGEGNDTDTDTDTEDVDVGEDDAAAGLPPLSGFSSAASTSDFPAVFKTPALTHPELFGPTPTASAAPASGFSGRQFRALPGGGGRKVGFGKTMSAPVGRLGGGWGMDVDMSGGAGAGAEGDEEDGFDVKDWAESENF